MVAKAEAIAAEAMVVETAVATKVVVTVVAVKAAKSNSSHILDIHEGNGESCCLFLCLSLILAPTREKEKEDTIYTAAPLQPQTWAAL